jgi:hypothetical protein
MKHENGLEDARIKAAIRSSIPRVLQRLVSMPTVDHREADGSAERVPPRVVPDDPAYRRIPQSGYPGNVGSQTKEPCLTSTNRQIIRIALDLEISWCDL